MIVNVLLVGNGAREHALAEWITRSPDARLFSWMHAKNPGIAACSQKYMLGKLDDFDALKQFIDEARPTIAIIGPEAPLGAGIVDFLHGFHIRCVGPTRVLAQVETSKSFLRDLMKKYQIKGLPLYQVFTHEKGLEFFMQQLPGIVIKPDGLTGGKGVKVQGDHFHDIQEALDYCKELFARQETVVVEEKLEGEEFSLQCLTDGKTVLAMPPAQDHKRAYKNDTGPNTGGMGSYTCANHLLPFLTKGHIQEAVAITEHVIHALTKETGEHYKGILYGGFMLTNKGVKLIEYNARFGDPEAMNVLPIITTDFVKVADALTKGKLDTITLAFAQKATVCKYLVPEGYPTHPVKGEIIDISDIARCRKKAHLYYAAVEEHNGKLVMGSSRAIAMVGIAPTLEEAEKIAQDAASKVKGKVFFREDIGTRALVQKRVDHMNNIMKSGAKDTERTVNKTKSNKTERKRP